MERGAVAQEYSYNTKFELNDEERDLLEKQNSRKISEFTSNKLEMDAQKNWDIFYKRNERRFFKDRHWTTREFKELIGSGECSQGEKRILLEVGCGVGNLVFPLKEEDDSNFFFYLMDFSPRAVAFVRSNPAFDPSRMEVFQADLIVDSLRMRLPSPADVVTLVFVLSAIHPDKFLTALRNLWEVMALDGVLLFRDYGLHDMAQMRFKPGHKIDDNFYARQDGTRTYFFSMELVKSLFKEAGFLELSCCYVHKRTINKKEGIDVPRIFVQGTFKKAQCPL